MPLKIAISTFSGYGNWFALRLQEEGHRVDIYQSNPYYANILKGITPKAFVNEKGNGKYPNYNKYDVSVFDFTGRPIQAEHSMTECPTLGDGKFQVEIEEDRMFGIELMEKAEIPVPPYEEFTDTGAAKVLIRKTGKRYVYKPDGMQTKDTTYVADDAEDMFGNIDKLFAKTHGSPFILQEFIKGIEVSVEGWFDGSEFYLLNATLEEKKFMNKGKGPNTGCSGNLVFQFGNAEPKIYKQGLAKIAPYLKSIGYRGMIDLNTIVTPTGLYGLEWTPRFGYDASAALLQLYGGNFGEMLYRIGTGQKPDISWKAEFAAGIRLSIPPYPSEIKGKHPAGVPIKGIRAEDYHRTFMYDVELQKDELVTAGVEGFICVPMGIGNSIGDAFDSCEEMVKRIKLPNAQYRTDVKECTMRRYRDLDMQGWLK